MRTENCRRLVAELLACRAGWEVCFRFTLAVDGRDPPKGMYFGSSSKKCLEVYFPATSFQPSPPPHPRIFSTENKNRKTFAAYLGRRLGKELTFS